MDDLQDPPGLVAAPPFTIGAGAAQDRLHWAQDGVEARVAKEVLIFGGGADRGPDLQYAVRVYGSATTQVPNNTWTAFPFSTVERQVGRMWVASAPTLLTIQRQGWYKVAVGVTFAASVTGNRGVRCRSITRGLIFAKQVQPCTSNPDVDSLHLLTEDFFFGQEQLVVEVWQDSGVALAVVAEDRQSPMCSVVYDNISV